VLYVCIPVHNEAATVGVLLWRLRTVLGETGRDYEVVVFDDGSTDDTAEVLAPYARVMPLTVLGGPGTAPRGRSAAVETLLRHVAAHSRYPRRDACLLMQGDFTDRAEDVPAFATAFDAGADAVVGRRVADVAQPAGERRLRRMGAWVLRPLVRADGVDDLLTSMRLFRVAVVRDLVRARGAAPLVEASGWAGVAELLVAVVPFARRMDVVDAPGRYDVRPRASRIDWAAELRALARYAWRARGTQARPPPPAPARDSRARRARRRRPAGR
jgi:glycosyltransferase involved in cell wall biosynthesis